jgi:hypothetical protein
MGAITKRHQGIRHLHKDVTHIQLTLEYDREWKNMLKKYIANWPKPMQSNFELLMTKKDLKDVLTAIDGIILLFLCANPVSSICAGALNGIL